MIQHQNATKLDGHFASREEAIAAAVDGCRAWMATLTLTGKAENQRMGILGELVKVLSAEMATA